MDVLKTIVEKYKKNILQFEEFTKKELNVNSELLNNIIEYLLKRKGKRVRPLLSFLWADHIKAINNNSYVAGFLVEMIHNASLIHDDVVDNSDKRRGKASLKAIWKNKISILSGDYLLAKSIYVACKYKTHPMIDYISLSLQEMSEGELIQLKRAEDFSTDIEGYFEVINKKTGILMGSSCACGAMSATDDKNIINNAFEFGKNYGIAFQIKDDLIDFDKETNTKKPIGNDLIENKITLPIIMCLEQQSATEQNRLLSLIKNFNYFDLYKFKEIQKITTSHKSFEKCNQIILDYSNKALSSLEKIPSDKNHNLLKGLIEHNIKRTS